MQSVYFWEKGKKQRYSELEQQFGCEFNLESLEDYNGVNLYYAQKYLSKVIEQIADECIAEEGGE